MRTKPTRFCVRMSEKEYTDLEMLAQRAKLSMADFFRLTIQYEADKMRKSFLALKRASELEARKRLGRRSYVTPRNRRLGPYPRILHP